MSLPKNERGHSLDNSAEEAIGGEHGCGYAAHIRHLVVVDCLETMREGSHVTLRVLEAALEGSPSSFATRGDAVPKGPCTRAKCR
jgi:hypothetical protein